MNKFTKNYLKNVRFFFPIMGRKERKYLKSLEITIDDFCETNTINSIEEIYKDFGLPSEVANSYFLSVETEYLMRRIGFAKRMKIIMIILVLLAFVGLFAHGLYLNHAYNLMQEQMIFFEETTIY